MKVRGISLAVASFMLGALVVVSFPATGAPQPGVVHFTAAGDYGSEASSNAVLDLIGATDPDMNFALGDLAYLPSGAEQSWCDRVTSRVGGGFPFELLAGNHESNNTDGNINDYSACLPNQLPGLVGTYGRQYYVDVPQDAPLVRFVMISPALEFPDGTWSYEPGTPRYNWTAASIDGARAAGIPWVVVGMHKPCFSLGQYGCEVGTGLINMLVSKKVDLVLSGHEHLYQRTHQLGLGAGCAALAANTVVPACIEDADASMSQNGTVFATVGTGGRPLRPINQADSERGYFAAFSGQNVSPADGILDVRATADTLQASFLPVVAGAFSDIFTIQRGGAPPNQPPTASFTAAPSGLSVAFNGSASSDPDGTISSYAWTFGDGTTGAGITTNHTYPAAGVYTATLVVTDNGGATGTQSQSVTVTAPPGEPVPFITDSFGRTVPAGLGTADLGGPWTVGGSTANYSVSGGLGRLLVAAGQTRTGILGATTSTDADLRVTLSIDKAATGSGLYINVSGRRITTTDDYRTSIRILANGSVVLSLSRGPDAGQTIRSGVTVPGLTYTAGLNLDLRLQVTGTNPTTLRARVWPTGQPEPTTWLVSVTDSTAALQAPGSVAVQGYLSSSATNSPITVRMDNLSVRRVA